MITLANQKSGIAIDTLCKALGIPRATYYRYQDDRGTKPVRRQPPKNALNDDEKKQITYYIAIVLLIKHRMRCLIL